MGSTSAIQRIDREGLSFVLWLVGLLGIAGLVFLAGLNHTLGRVVVSANTIWLAFGVFTVLFVLGVRLKVSKGDDDE